MHGLDFAGWARRYYKKAEKLPRPMFILQKRALSQSFQILENIDGVPFHELSMSLYFLCQDLQMQDFTRRFESQIELAAANPEKFVFGLHKFFNETENYIKKNDLYQAFFEFFYRIFRKQTENQNKQINDNVITAYVNLLMQQLEYLKPDKFNNTVRVAGMTTDGEIMTTPDFLPNSDVPGYNIEKLLYSSPNVRSQYKFEELIVDEYKRAGYPVNSMFDIEVIQNQDKVQVTSLYSLLPFINEYTYDILITNLFSTNMTFMLSFESEAGLRDDLVNVLKRRKRTLPSNGVIINFRPNPCFQSLLLKETLYDGHIFMLYRITTGEGDLNGYYDVRDGLFSSVLTSAEIGEKQSLENKFASLILYCYACYVLDNESYALATMGKHFSHKEFGKLEADGYLRGGKLINEYRQEKKEGEKHARIGDPNYETAQRAIQGYIRKLPAGQKASQEAIDYAESLGYDLAPNETYVRPFIKMVFRLKTIDDASPES